MKTIALETADERLVEVFRALGHPARLRIVRVLMQCERCVCGELVDELPLVQATVSQHLKVLKEAGIVIGEIEDPAVCYCLAPGALATVHDAVAHLVSDVGEPVGCHPTG